MVSRVTRTVREDARRVIRENLRSVFDDDGGRTVGSGRATLRPVPPFTVRLKENTNDLYWEGDHHGLQVHYEDSRILPGPVPAMGCHAGIRDDLNLPQICKAILSHHDRRRAGSVATTIGVVRSECDGFEIGRCLRFIPDQIVRTGCVLAQGQHFPR